MNLGFDIIDSAFSAGLCPVFRAGKETPMNLSIARITGVYKTHTGGDLSLYIVRNDRSKKYSLVWTRGDVVWNFDMSKSSPFPAHLQPGIRAVCKGAWVSKREMNEKISAIFDRCDSRGVFL